MIIFDRKIITILLRSMINQGRARSVGRTGGEKCFYFTLFFIEDHFGHLKKIYYIAFESHYDLIERLTVYIKL